MMRNRRGFTLVELMVAMALTMFIMVILSQAFVTTLDAFSYLKGIGDMEASLRTASNIIRSDLLADHFQGKLRLSDTRFNNVGYVPPQEGFFYIRNISTAPGTQGFMDDADSIPEYPGFGTVATPYRYVMNFTVKARGNRPEDFFFAPVPPGSPVLTLPVNYFNQPGDALYTGTNTINSQWAEVAYFLVQTGSIAQPGNPAVGGADRLYSLYRSQYVLLPYGDSASAALIPNAALSGYTGVAAVPNLAKGTLAFLSPRDVAGVNQNGDVTTGSPVVNNLLDTSSLMPTMLVYGATGGAPSFIASITSPTQITLTNPATGATGTRVLTFVNRTLETTTVANPFPTKRGEPLVVGQAPSGSSLVVANVLSFQVRVLRTFQSALATAPPGVLPGATPTTVVPGVTLNAGATNLEVGTELEIDFNNVHHEVCRVVNKVGNVVDVVPMANFHSATAPIRYVGADFVNGGTFDTATAVGYRIVALQIILRIWDPKSQQVRQITMVQEM